MSDEDGVLCFARFTELYRKRHMRLDNSVILLDGTGLLVVRHCI